MSQTYSAQPSPSSGPDFLVVVSAEDEYLSSFHQFAEKVNRKLRAGYQLHGQPFNIDKTLCQAMVRVEGFKSTSETTIFYKRAEQTHSS